MRPTIVPKMMTAERQNEIVTQVYCAPECGLRQMGVDLLAHLFFQAQEIQKYKDELETLRDNQDYTYDDCDCNYCSGTSYDDDASGIK